MRSFLALLDRLLPAPAVALDANGRPPKPAAMPDTNYVYQKPMRADPETNGHFNVDDPGSRMPIGQH